MAGYFVQAVVATAVLTFVVWPWVGPEPRMALALINAVRGAHHRMPVRPGACDPHVDLVATGKGAMAGVLFKNAEAIEVMKKVDTLVVDKTGTLTLGKPMLVRCRRPRGSRKRIFSALAASLEQGSEHPLGAAIVSGAIGKGAAL